jgi:GTP pyrophosphokinase
MKSLTRGANRRRAPVADCRTPKKATGDRRHRRRLPGRTRWRVRAFAEPLIAGETLDTGENTLAHADAVAAILKSMGGSEAMQAASYLVYACAHLNKPQEVIAKAFGDSFAALAMETTKLVRVQQLSRASGSSAIGGRPEQGADRNVRKMLLAFSRDLRVVMLRLASRLQTLRYHAASKPRIPPSLARESLQVFAPLANRLGIWQVKWEMEDLAFRFLEPDTYRKVAGLLDEKRVEREAYVEQLRQRLEAELRARASATVQGRPKHIYSIVQARCAASRWTSTRCLTCARCAWWCPREGLLRRAELGA